MPIEILCAIIGVVASIIGSVIGSITTGLIQIKIENNHNKLKIYEEKTLLAIYNAIEIHNMHELINITFLGFTNAQFKNIIVELEDKGYLVNHARNNNYTGFNGFITAKGKYYLLEHKLINDVVEHEQNGGIKGKQK